MINCDRRDERYPQITEMPTKSADSQLPYLQIIGAPRTSMQAVTADLQLS